MSNSRNKLKSNLYVVCHNEEKVDRISQKEPLRTKNKSNESASSSVFTSTEIEENDDRKDSNKISYL